MSYRGLFGIYIHFFAYRHGSELFKEQVTDFIANQWSRIELDEMDIAMPHPEFLIHIMSKLGV